MREWRKITNRPNYSVSNDGLVRNDKTGRILKQSCRKDNYMQVMLGRKTVPLYVHRLVAQAFIENPKNLPQVDHIDGNKRNNDRNNLRWVSASENCYNFGYETRIESKRKKIKATNGEKQIIFASRNECAKFFECSKSEIAYGRVYKKGNKKGWLFEIVKDIV